MFTLAAISSEGDPEITNRYVKSVKLALDLSESTPGQFKLIETPLNSFLLVANVMPDPQPVEYGGVSADIDFSNLHLPRLGRLSEVLRPLTGITRVSEDTNVAVGRTTWPAAEPLTYQTYTTEQWISALTMNRDQIVEEAMVSLADPSNWKGLYPDDPLPLVWLLFNGPASFCKMECCLYEQHCGYPGPVLLPGHMYVPQNDLQSFVNHTVKYTKFLYGNFSGAWPEDRLPFCVSRIQRAVSQLQSIEASDTYLSQSCLLCHIYRQNSAISEQSTHVGPILVLGGQGTQYITSRVRSQRCISTGDYYLLPSYDISAIITMLKENDLHKF
ncbi:UL95 [Colobine gammaherpesvirus 1]|uniref:UL95 n=1 Tax=Colobine gammaherpesvirus 1 TaxID=2597325 RepID=A0A5B8FKG0_9GAMA|nr:UL95 [Colobine gammaherpesvirus 1]QDQ69242.1 UL95 [Colobine gammaherpesvirus 1]